MEANTTGSNNVAVGLDSLALNTTASNNTAVGCGALSANTTAGSNTAVGRLSLFDNTTASFNTGLGIESLTNNTTGANNVAVGHQSLCGLTTGSQNVAVGRHTLDAVTTGDNNTVIGDYAGSDAMANIVDSGSNHIILGNNGSAVAKIKIDWTVVSDARDKMNIENVPHGLDFVNQLNPIKFDFKKSRNDATPHGLTRYGFKAQDIMALEGDNPIIINNDDPEHLGYTAANMVPVLVNAIKELKAEIDLLKKK